MMSNKMSIVLFALFFVSTTANIPEPTDPCVTVKNSLLLASQLVKQLQGTCNENVTTGGNQEMANYIECATKGDVRDMKQELMSLRGLVQSCRKDTCGVFYPRDCQDLLLQGHRESRVYTIFPKNGSSFQVFCDQETDGGGWTVLQRRQDGSEDFFRTWYEYKTGFGNLSNEFWLGNDKIHTLSESGNYSLRIDLKDFSGNSRHASYSTFNVGNEESGYLLKVLGYTGNAVNSMSIHNNATFVTKDRDNERSCANRLKGGWWYRACHEGNLNGLYLRGEHKSYADGINWYKWKGYHYSLKYADMKIRRTIN